MSNELNQELQDTNEVQDASEATTPYITKDELLARMDVGYRELIQYVSTLDDNTIVNTVVYGDLTTKDVMSHLATWASMASGWARKSINGEQVVRLAPGYEISEDASDEEWDKVLDAFNAHVYEENKAKSLDEVLTALDEAQDALLDVVESSTDPELNSTKQDSWPQNRPIWTYIAGNSFGHYVEHLELLKQNLDDKGPSREDAKR